MNMRTCILGAAALIISACAGLQREPTNEELVEDFLQTLTIRQSKYHGHYDRKTLLKFDGPILWTILGNPRESTKVHLESTLRAYKNFMHTDFREAQPGEVANYVIAFIPSRAPSEVLTYLDEWIRKRQSKNEIHNEVILGISMGTHRQFLHARYYYSHPNLIYQNTYCNVYANLTAGYAVAYIAEDYPDVRRCVSEETIQALGLFYDTTKMWSSIMAVDHQGFRGYERDTASAYDLSYLRVLYDPRLWTGMTRDEAKPIVRAIFDELRPDQTNPPELDRLFVGSRENVTNMRSKSDKKYLD